MPTKKEWLEAVKTKIADYKADWRSYGRADDCSFCRLNSYRCDKCIMTHEKHSVACIHMRTYPRGTKYQTAKRIKFWEQAYKILSKLSPTRFTQFRKGTSFPELWTLDESMPANKSPK